MKLLFDENLSPILRTGTLSPLDQPTHSEPSQMQTIQISEQTAQQLNDMAAQEHISGNDLIERLINKHSQELAKQRELKAFFKPYQRDMTGFKFDREEANAR